VLTMDISLDKNTAALIRSFSSKLDVRRDTQRPVLDAGSIGESLRVSPGMARVDLVNKTPSTLSGTLNISNIGDFLSTAEKKSPRFITFEETSLRGSPSSGRIQLLLDRETGEGVLSLLAEEIRDYLSSLMAPIATGEVLTKDEYLELVESIYGRGVRDEIAAARVKANVRFPGQIQSLRGGSASGRQAIFDIPLIDLLVLDVPCRYEARW